MKLYATITNCNGKRVGTGDNEALTIELKYKNTIVRSFSFRIEEGTGGYNWEIEETKGKN